jgi:hypothetical protein
MYYQLSRPQPILQLDSYLSKYISVAEETIQLCVLEFSVQVS